MPKGVNKSLGGGIFILWWNLSSYGKAQMTRERDLALGVCEDIVLGRKLWVYGAAKRSHFMGR